MVLAAALLAAIGAAMVVAPLLRVKRRMAALENSQLLVALDNLAPEITHLQRSLTMLASQFAAIKTALDEVRAGVAQLRTPLAGPGFTQLKAQFGALFDLLR